MIKGIRYLLLAQINISNQIPVVFRSMFVQWACLTRQGSKMRFIANDNDKAGERLAAQFYAETTSLRLTNP